MTSNPQQVLAQAHAQHKALKREQARRRIHERVRVPIEQPHALRDPLVHEDSAVLSTFGAARLFVIAIVLHVLIVSFFLLVNRFVGDGQERLSERVAFKVVEIPPPAEPVAEEEAEEEPEEVVVEEETPTPSDFTPEVPEPEPPPTQKPKPPKEVKTESPEPSSESPEPAEPVRRTIGLDFESTVSGGSGPSFATGTSRMGKTETQAKDPSEAKQAPSGTGNATSTQRAATRIPTRDVEFVKPKRLRPATPRYPAELKAQETEGDVKVSVELDETGKVTSVRVIDSSGQPAFDAAARQAAMQEKFSPALRDGKAVAYTLSYTYRFRIDDE